MSKLSGTPISSSDIIKAISVKGENITYITGDDSSYSATVDVGIDNKIANSLSNTSSSLSTAMSNFISTTINNALNGKDTTSSLYTTVRNMTFTNLPPKVGFLDDTKVNLQGTFNMSYMSNRSGPFYISDAEGRECLFATATNTSYGSIARNGVYRATRMTSSEDFVWENNAIRPKFVQEMSGYTKNNDGPLYDNIRVINIFNITSDYVGLTVHNDTNNTDKNYFVFTNGSGSPNNWSTSLGYIDVTNVTNVSYLARIVISSNVYYIIPTIESQNATTTDPTLNTTDTTSTNYLYFTIYKATENITNHTVSLTYIRKDTICRGGWDYINSSWANFSSLSNFRLIYIKHMQCLFAIGYSADARYGYTNNTKQYWDSSGNHRFQWGLISLSNTDYITSTTTNYFSQSNRWSAHKLGYQYNRTRYNYNQWGMPIPYITYDELKHSIGIVMHESRDWGGVPSRFRLSIFGIDSASAQQEFIKYISLDSTLRTRFPYSFSPSGYTNFQAEIECMEKVLLSDDTAPWSKSIMTPYIINDLFIINCFSKKYNNVWAHITPTLLLNASTQTPYSTNIFTCTTAKWAISKGSLDFTRNSTVYTGGSNANFYYYNENTRQVLKSDISTITLQDNSTVNTFQPNVNTSVVMTFPDHNPDTILRNHYASQISSHGVSVSGIQISYRIYGTNSTLGGDFILYYCVLRCNINNKKISTTTSSDDGLTLMYPSILLYFSNGSSKVYNIVTDFTWNKDNYKNTIIHHSYTNPIATGRSITGYVSGGYHMAFIDKDGSLSCTTLVHTPDIDSYCGPWSTGFDFINKKAYIMSNGSETWVNHVYGYSKSLGYYLAHPSYSYEYLRIYCDKDYLNGGASKGSTSMIDMLTNGKTYYKDMYTSSSTNKIAFVSKTALYLGGYFSYLPAQEIYLKNGHNYIYITRKNASYDLTVDVYDHLIGIPGQSQFNRILISHIYVSNNLIVSQIDYDIAYYPTSSTV